MRIYLLSVVLFLLSSSAFARSNDFETGTVIDTVRCLDDPNQSYALYLPSDYTPKRVWPLIYAFDPAARGALPVKLLETAAEKYGYIVVGSNNSRNGPLQAQFDAANALSVDTQKRFSLNPFRLYTMGFSGGARLASTVAVQSGKIAGVIACGASFIAEYAPKPNAAFAYAGTVGKKDMNYTEMRHYAKKLDGLNYPNRLFVFDGGHRWPPEKIFMEVLAWLELHAMRNDTQNTDHAWIDSLFTAWRTEAQKLKKSGQLLKAYQAYTKIAADFKGIHALDSVKAEIERCENMDEVKRAREREEEIQHDELDYLNKFVKAFASLKDDLAENGDFDKTEWWQEEIRDLKKEYQKAESGREELMYVRILSWIAGRCSQESGFALRQNNPKAALVYLQIWDIVQPQHPFKSYQFARAYALAGETDLAIQALNTAVQLGFRNVTRIENDTLLVPLRKHQKYITIVSSLKHEDAMINR